MTDNSDAPLTPRRIMNMASAFYESCLLFTASDLGIFAHLSETNGSTLKQVVEACELDSRGARLVLDGCAALGFLVKRGDMFHNAPDVDAFLVPGRPGDLSRAIRYNRDVYDAWGHLPGLAKTGAPVERPEIHLGEDPERTRAFVLSMHSRAMGIGQSVVPQLALAGRKQLLDLAGGPGTYSVLMAKASPELQCTVLDLPAVAAVAQELIKDAGMQDRVTCLPGDYHVAEFPDGNDVVTIFGALHQESPEAIRDILARAYEALEPGGLLYVLDMMTDATRTAPKFSALFAINMALTTQHGWVFSDAELEQWMTDAGFVGFSCKPVPPPMPHWLACGYKPNAAGY